MPTCGETGFGYKKTKRNRISVFRPANRFPVYRLQHYFKPGRLVFIIVINTSCLGICYAIYARQKFFHNALRPNGARALFEFLPDINSVINVLTLSIYSYIKYNLYYLHIRFYELISTFPNLYFLTVLY